MDKIKDIPMFKTPDVRRQRLTGIDLFRGLAIYAVIVLHSDEPLTSAPVGWQTILEFSKFAVPFFLATSFYLTFKKFYKTSKEVSLGARLYRLLVPYGVWSAIYFAYKCLKYALDGDLSKIGQISQNWFALIFSGGAAFHLYFLPLLMAGTVLIKVIEMWRRQKQPLPLMVVLPTFGLSLALYQSLLTSGNAFNNAAGTAFSTFSNTVLSTTAGHNLVLRAGFIVLAWMIRCLPYIFLAMLLANPKVDSYLSQRSQIYCSLLVLAFVGINLFGIQILPTAVYEVFRGYITLALALAISPFLKDTFLIKNLGACSFGIYLMHLLFVESFYIVVTRVLPASFMANISSVMLLLVSIFILLMTGLLTQLLRKTKRPALLLLGG